MPRFNILTIKDGHTYINGVQLNWIDSLSVETNEVGNAVLKLEMLVESGEIEDSYKHLYDRIRKLECSEARLRAKLESAERREKRSWAWGAVATVLITTVAIVALKAIILW